MLKSAETPGDVPEGLYACQWFVLILTGEGNRE